MAIRSAAMIQDGIVVNVSVYDEDASSDWLAAIAPDYDEIRIVDEAGVGWTVEEDGLRPPPPYPSWIWNGSEWSSPAPRPEGPYYWDESAVEWKPVP